MIKNISDFKNKSDYWLSEALSSSCTSRGDELEIREIQRIISLISSDVIDEMNGVREFVYEIDLDTIIDTLSHGGKIKKLSEVDFDE